MLFGFGCIESFKTVGKKAIQYCIALTFTQRAGIRFYDGAYGEGLVIPENKMPAPISSNALTVGLDSYKLPVTISPPGGKCGIREALFCNQIDDPNGCRE